jgi:hypothetical protein
MKKVGVFLLCAMFALFTGISALAQEEKKENTADKKKKPRKELRRITPEKELDFKELERSMEHLEYSLRVLEDFEMPPLPPIPELPVLAEFQIEIPEIQIPEIEIPALHFEMPEIEIPEMRFEIPEFAIPPIEIPDFEWDAFHFDGEPVLWGGEWEFSNRFHDLTDEEELRVQALRSLAREAGGEAIAMIEKVLKQDESAAVRYHAVRLLRRHLDNDKAIEMLGETARNDRNAEVKKVAIRLLGKSGSPPRSGNFAGNCADKINHSSAFLSFGNNFLCEGAGNV